MLASEVGKPRVDEYNDSSLTRLAWKEFQRFSCAETGNGSRNCTESPCITYW